MDRIQGGPADDVIEAGRGDAQIDGAGGVNLVSLHGSHDQYPDIGNLIDSMAAFAPPSSAGFFSRGDQALAWQPTLAVSA